MDNNSDEQFIIVHAVIEANKQGLKSNKQDSDGKIMNITEYFKSMLSSPITSITDKIKSFKSSPTQKNSPNPLVSTTMVPANRMSSPLDGGQSMKIGGIWNMKHEISPPKLY